MNSVSVVLTQTERAARLHAYVSQKHSRFSLEAASRVVALVEPHWHEPVKSLAKHVSAALVAQGMDVGHQSVLQATARLQGHADYFNAPRKPNTLEIFVHGVASQALPVADWRACANLLVDACERWLGENHLSRLLRLDISPSVLCVYGMVPGSGDVVGGSDPIALGSRAGELASDVRGSSTRYGFHLEPTSRRPRSRTLLARCGGQALVGPTLARDHEGGTGSSSSSASKTTPIELQRRSEKAPGRRHTERTERTFGDSPQAVIPASDARPIAFSTAEAMAMQADNDAQDAHSFATASNRSEPSTEANRTCLHAVPAEIKHWA